MHKGATLRNSNQVLGLVVYTGRDTKLALNLSKYRFKMSSLEKNVNWILVGNLITMFSLAFICALFNLAFAERNIDDWYVFHDLRSTKELAFKAFLSFWLLYNRMIPLELMVIMEIAKFISTMFI